MFGDKGWMVTIVGEFEHILDVVEAGLSDNDVKKYDEFFGGLKSSYQTNRFWRLFYLLGAWKDWGNIAELGVLNGYSLIALAAGAKKYNTNVVGYDLFEDYKYNNSEISTVENNINSFPLDLNIVLAKKNIIGETGRVWMPDDASLISVDLSNCGRIYRSVIDAVDFSEPKLIIFEGGSESRDQVDWMLKYKREPIHPFLKKEIKSMGLFYKTIDLFPSITFVTNDFNIIPPPLLNF